MEKPTYAYIPDKLPAATRRVRLSDTAFEGLSLDGTSAGRDRASSARVHGMNNLSPRAGDALATRLPRGKYLTPRGSGTPHGVAVLGDTIYFVEGTTLYSSTGSGVATEVGAVADTDKEFAVFGNFLLILPDRLYVDGEGGPLRVMRAGTGTLEGIVFSGNTITLPSSSKTWVGHGFRAGDGIQVLASTTSGVNPTGIYRIAAVMGRMATMDTTWEEGMTITGSISCIIPELKHITVLGQRAFGISDKQMYVSAVGTPFNWYAPTPDTADAPVTFRCDAGGNFTACTSWQGYPIFFKSDRICRLAGGDSDSYSLLEMTVPGIPASLSRTLCTIGGDLYYRSADGVYRYGGQHPVRVGTLPEDDISGGVGGTDGRSYYLSVPGVGTTRRQYVYDPVSERWYIETSHIPVASVTHNGLHYSQASDGYLWVSTSDGRSTGCSLREGTLSSWVSFDPEHPAEPDLARPVALYIRATGETDATLTVRAALSDGRTPTDASFAGAPVLASFRGAMTDRLLRIPLHLPPADGMTLRLDMTGSWVIHAIIREYEVPRVSSR